MDTSQRRGKYFEEFGVGQRIVTAGRTVTEADVVGFAGLTGDYNQIHTDAEFARNTLYAQRVAHGLLGLSIASGLAVQTGVMEGTVLAFREVNEWKFSRPVFLGDTLHAELEVVSTKAIPRLGGGSVELRVSVNNQKDETVMAGRWTILMQGRPSADP
jgi:acyl dehydratase